ncbi:MAG: hypothetical protein ACKVRP_15790, partial [Bacteroidota bacterium]
RRSSSRFVPHPQDPFSFLLRVIVRLFGVLFILLTATVIIQPDVGTKLIVLTVGGVLVLIGLIAIFAIKNL